MKTTSTISDEKGFWRHCEVAEMLFRMGVDPHTTHHIREAIREASKKLGRVRTKDKRRRAEYVSEAAEIELLNGRNKNLDEDHIVPISVIKKQILKLNRPNKSQIASIIRRWSSLALITHQEHRKLLYARMPADWNKRDSFARYKAVGISLKKNRYAELPFGKSLPRRASQ